MRGIPSATTHPHTHYYNAEGDDEDDKDDGTCLLTDLDQELMLSFQLPDLRPLLVAVREQQLIGRADAGQHQEVGHVLDDAVILLLSVTPPSHRHT